MNITIEKTALHSIPSDVKKAISSSKSVDTWNDSTPLARNEWVCWVTSAKMPQTRIKRINQMIDMFKKGKRRPCCWPGCSHRK